MALLTRCPKCESEYEVTSDQLKLRDGLVRCGQCSQVFDGFACLKDDLPTLTRKAADLSAKRTPNAPTLIPDTLARPHAVADGEVSHNASIESGATSAFQPIPRTSSTGNPDLGTFIDKPASASAEPFVPSVDRRNPPADAPLGRQEPAWRLGHATPAADESIEPSLGRLDESVLRSDAREPSFEGATLPGTVLSSEATPRRDPQVRVFGESRLKGDDPSAFGRTVPEFLEDEEEVSETTSILWLLGSIVLALVLVIQSLVVFRNDIVASMPSLRPLLAHLCQPLSCEVSYVRQIDRIFIVGSSLQQAPDASVSGNQRAYVLRLTLQNRGAYPQPWPALMLTLTDASGTAVIKKALLPSEFLPPNLLEGPMATRQEVGLDIPLTVDGLNISGYELERFFP